MSKYEPTRRQDHDTYAKSLETVCPVCGKEFYISVCELWTWKFIHDGQMRYFCSYGCRQAMRKSLEGAMEDKEEQALMHRRAYYHRRRARKEAKPDDDS